MNKTAIFPVIFLLLLGAAPKNYEHTYHTGGVVLAKLGPGQTSGRAKCVLDYTITNDSLIEGRFQVANPPSDWNIASEFIFHGIITQVNSPISFGRRIQRVYPMIGTVQTYPDSSHPEGSFEWETRCSFDDQPGMIQISKTTGDDHFHGTLESGSKLSFYLE